jgi:hypothetical protein
MQIPNQVIKPAIAVIWANQSKTLPAPLETAKAIDQNDG